MQEEGVNLKKWEEYMHDNFVDMHIIMNFLKEKVLKLENLNTNTIFWQLASYMQDATVLMLTSGHANIQTM